MHVDLTPAQAIRPHAPCTEPSVDRAANAPKQRRRPQQDAGGQPTLLGNAVGAQTWARAQQARVRILEQRQANTVAGGPFEPNGKIQRPPAMSERCAAADGGCPAALPQSHAGHAIAGLALAMAALCALALLVCGGLARANADEFASELERRLVPADLEQNASRRRPRRQRRRARSTLESSPSPPQPLARERQGNFVASRLPSYLVADTEAVPRSGVHELPATIGEQQMQLP